MDDYERPLRPLHMPEHVNRYKEIDNYIDQFKRFREVFKEPAAWLAKGHLFIVTGDSGYGKTSLRQRCAFWMLTEHIQSHCEVRVFDFSDESWESDTTDTRLVRVRDRVLRGLDGPLDPADIGRIANIKDMTDSFYELGTVLRSGSTGDGSNPIVLVVLLPGYPEPEELKRYYDLAREGMVFLAEVFDPDAIEAIAGKIDKRPLGFRRDSIDMHILQLGTLKAGDDELLLKWMQADLRNCPKLTDAEVVTTLNHLIQNRKIGTSQLLKLLIGALRIAIDEQASEVTVRHIDMYHQSLLYKPA